MSAALEKHAVGTPAATDSLRREASIEASREYVRKQISCAPPEILRLKDPAAYNVGLERALHELRSTLTEQAKEL